MRSARPTRVLLALSVSGLLLGAAGCTAHDDSPTVAQLTRSSADSVAVVAQSDPSARSVAASRALFASAPGAVVASASDAEAVGDAASAAEAAHVPLLLTDGGDRVAGELRRLGAAWYQAEGDVSVDTDVPEQDDAPEGADAPEATDASRPATVVVADRRADAAAVATAEAAGARVVAMPDGVTDPAAAPDVVSALHDRAEHPTVLVGSAFGDLPDPEWTVRAAESGWQLPHGGQRPFDGHRYVACTALPARRCSACWASRTRRRPCVAPRAWRRSTTGSATSR